MENTQLTLVDFILKSPIQNANFKKCFFKSDKVNTLSELALSYIKAFNYPETNQYKMAVQIAIQSEYGLGKRSFNLEVRTPELHEFYSSYPRLTGKKMPEAGSKVEIINMKEPYIGCILALVTDEVENRLYSYVPEKVAIELAKKNGWEIIFIHATMSNTNISVTN